MTKFQNKYLSESIRLKTWDYSNASWYFITICTEKHINYFGSIINEKMILNQLGDIAFSSWNEIHNHYPNVDLDYSIIMPNHIHGIIIIRETVETRHASPQHTKNVTLSNIVGSFKSAVTKEAHTIGIQEFAWQTSFWDRIIRNEKELYLIRRYIEQNPLKWELEKNHPENMYEL